LTLKAKFESGASIFSFQRLSQARSTYGQAGVKPGSSWGQAGVKPGSSWGQDGVKLGSSWGQHAPPNRGSLAREERDDGIPRGGREQLRVVAAQVELNANFQGGSSHDIFKCLVPGAVYFDFIASTCIALPRKAGTACHL